MSKKRRPLPPPRHGPQLGDAPVQQKYLELMNGVAKGLDGIFNGKARGKDRKTGFVLLVFPFNEGQLPSPIEDRCNFISNGADRNDVVVLMKEMIRRFEGQPEMEGRA